MCNAAEGSFWGAGTYNNHKNIMILSNTFTGFSYAPVIVNSADTVLVQSNKFNQCFCYPSYAGHYPGPVAVAADLIASKHETVEELIEAQHDMHLVVYVLHDMQCLPEGIAKPKSKLCPGPKRLVP